MHQTFYIDVDEEISSVIDRLKKSMAVDNYFVTPKRAIFLQSIVNLKLLKREAEKIKKHVILVTQEDLAVAMANRIGLDVLNSIEGMDEILDVEKNEVYASSNEDIEDRVVDDRKDDKRTRLNNVGSNDFFDDHTAMDVHRHAHISRNEELKNVQSHVAAVPHEDKRRLSKNVPVAHRVNGVGIRKNDMQASAHGRAMTSRNNMHSGVGVHGGLSADKEKTLEKMFSQRKPEVVVVEKQISNGKTKKLFFMFVFGCLILFGGVAAYLYIPTAKVDVVLNIQTAKADADVLVGGTEQTDNTIAVHVIEKQEQLTLQYNSTGKSSSYGKKAHGTVVVYNEFDQQSQTLLATTRIQAKDGKIFRLVKTIIVPGASNVGGEMKPGVISAEVTADEPGSDYNIPAGEFTIPGFKGSPKFDKFSVKSSEDMIGGTTEEDAAAGVSQGDIENAQKKTEIALREKIAIVIAGEMTENEVDLPEAEKITIEKSFAGAKIGDAVGSFDYTAVASVHVLIFSQQDVKNVFEKTDQFKNQPTDASKVIKKLEYGSVEPNFENNTILLKVHGEIEITPNIDLGVFKKEILGKNEEELISILKKNQNVKSVNVEFWPTFVSRIPQYTQRVQVEIQK